MKKGFRKNKPIHQEKNYNQLMEAANQVGQESLQGALGIATNFSKNLIRGSASVTNKVITSGMDWIFGGDIRNQSVSQLTEEAKEKLYIMSQIIAEVARDPETQELLQSIADHLAELAQEVLNAAQPKLEESMQNSIMAARKMASEGAGGVVKVGFDMIGAAVGNVPFLGGLVNLCIAIGRAFNSIMSIAKTGSDNFYKSAALYAKIIKEILPYAENATNEFIEDKRKAQGIIKRVSNLSDKLDTKVREGINNQTREKMKNFTGTNNMKEKMKNFTGTNNMKEKMKNFTGTNNLKEKMKNFTGKKKRF